MASSRILFAGRSRSIASFLNFFNQYILMCPLFDFRSGKNPFHSRAK